MTLGAVIALTAAVEGILSWISSWIWRTSVAAALLSGAFALLPLSRVIADDFSPCNAGVVGGAPPNWGPTGNPGLVGFRAKSACAWLELLTPITALPTIAWAHDTETIRGEQQRWTEASALIFVEWKAPALSLAMRRPNASVKDPVTVIIRSPGRTVRRVITTSDWWYETLPLPATLLDRLAAMHRVEISVDPTYSLTVGNAAGDLRSRGVQFQILQPVPEK